MTSSPDPFPAILADAAAHHRAGRLAQAERLYRAVIQAVPDHADALHLLGVLYWQAGAAERAAVWLRRALRTDPAFVGALNHYGLVLHAQGHERAAHRAFANAVCLRPDFASALTHAGAMVVSGVAAGGADGEDWHRRALRCDPAHAAAWGNLAQTLVARGDAGEACRQGRRVLALAPADVDALANLASIEALLNRPDDAGRLLGRVVRLAPHHSLGRSNRALWALAYGLLDEGWAGYESRFDSPSFHPPRPVRAPRWRGGPLRRGPLLVWGEQGVGDEILFSSCLGDFKVAPGMVTVDADPRLAGLLSRSFPVLDIRTAGTPEPTPVAHIPMGSLPRLCRPRLARFPIRNGWLTPDPDRAAQWRERLAVLGPGLRVGLAWCSQVVTARRQASYLRLEDFAPLFRVTGVHFIPLQHGPIDQEVRMAEERHGVPLHRWSDLDLRDDFDGVAALMAGLDLMVSVAVSAGELAAGLGIPVWRAVPAADWTQLGTAVRPWYGSMRLFPALPGEPLTTAVPVMAAALAALRSSFYHGIES